MQAHSLGEPRRLTGRGDEVGAAAVRRYGAARRLDPHARGQHALFIGQPGQLQQAGLAGGVGEDADGVFTGQHGVVGEAGGVGGAHQQALPEGDVTGREGDDPGAVGGAGA